MTQEMAQEQTIQDDPIAVRKAKRAALMAHGQEAYAYRFAVSAKAAQLAQDYAQLENGQTTTDVVSVAGRIMALRDQGKILFMVLADDSGQIQLFCRINTLGEEQFDALRQLDVGDFVGCTGAVMRTRRGELSLAAECVVLLTKALRPLPEKFHGLNDKETRYRQRYVDLIMNPEVKSVFIKRFKIIDALRREATARGFIEVETPMLHPIPGGATARPFITHHNTLDKDLYLRVAPELHLKRLLVGGFERVFEINRSFRNEGMDHTHNPEFTMLEAYQAYTDADGIADFTRELIQAACLAAQDTLEIEYQGQQLNLGGTWPKRSMIELTSQALGQELSYSQDVKELTALANRHHIATLPGWGTGKLIAVLFEKLVEDTITHPVFVTEHPLETSPLAKKKAGNALVTDRYELMIAGREYANLFSELNDPVDQRERFAAQMVAKAAGDEEAMGYDEDYIRALEYGMPPAGGVGIGVDRLVMLLTNAVSIKDVLLFPHMRDEER
ncbi:MAG: lysine--tRNA ligase [Coriobacteriales bacterium]|jgi:lysyl-tRNA synthetase class 2|nr:lysine--tRNA ligase [Coriobacteriales bacterium]